MIIRNAKLIRQMRKPGICVLCERPCNKREGHHIPSRGAGGSDFRLMLVSVCRPCHSLRADSAAGMKKCLESIAARDKTTVDAVQQAQWFLVKLDKHASKYAIEEALVKLPSPAKEIARRELEEAKKL